MKHPAPARLGVPKLYQISDRPKHSATSSMPNNKQSHRLTAQDNKVAIGER
jgi:hypothetical protein